MRERERETVDRDKQIQTDKTDKTDKTEKRRQRGLRRRGWRRRRTGRGPGGDEAPLSRVRIAAQNICEGAAILEGGGTGPDGGRRLYVKYETRGKEHREFKDGKTNVADTELGLLQATAVSIGREGG